MILTEYLTRSPSRMWDYALQAGVTHATVRPPDSDFDPADYGQFADFYQQFISAGLTPVVLEPMPNSLHDHIKAGDSMRDESIDKVIRMMPVLNRLNLRVICTNFMAYIGWFRTRRDLPERGGALVTGFDRAECPDKEPLRITRETLWENLGYFLKAVLPAAERHGIRIALHPDDPPVPRLTDVERILVSREAIDRALALAPSSSLGVTLCQGCFAAMGESIPDSIRHYAAMGKLFFVHFRDVAGTPDCFRETFHDNGPTDMAEAIRAYRDCGYTGPVRVDHVPTMAGEANEAPGYAGVGRLYALGYLKGLLEGSSYPYW